MKTSEGSNLSESESMDNTYYPPEPRNIPADRGIARHGIGRIVTASIDLGQSRTGRDEISATDSSVATKLGGRLSGLPGFQPESDSSHAFPDCSHLFPDRTLKATSWQPSG
jgi:hypothetical protein